MILLVDTNVLLDVLLERDPFFAPAVELWEKTETARCGGFAGAALPVITPEQCLAVIAAQR